MQKLTPSPNLQHNHKNAGKILKEDIAKRKFINKFKNTVTKQHFETKPEAGVSEILKMKLRKVDLNEKCERKCGLTDENLQSDGGMKKQNFKDKLSKFKFLEAGGHTVCLYKNGTPGAETNLQTIPKKKNKLTLKSETFP